MILILWQNLTIKLPSPYSQFKRGFDHGRRGEKMNHANTGKDYSIVLPTHLQQTSLYTVDVRHIWQLHSRRQKWKANKGSDTDSNSGWIWTPLKIQKCLEVCHCMKDKNTPCTLPTPEFYYVNRKGREDFHICKYVYSVTHYWFLTKNW